MRAVDVLAKRDLLHTLVTRDSMFRMTATNTMNLRLASGFMTVPREHRHTDADAYHRMVALPTVSALRMGETFLVAPDMAHLAQMAAEDRPPEELMEGDIPATHGFMWIEGGVRMYDVRADLNKIHAITWVTAGSAIVLLTFTSKYDIEDVVNRRLRDEDPKRYRALPELTWTGDLVVMHYGETTKPTASYKNLGDRSVSFKDLPDGTVVLCFDDTGGQVPEDDLGSNVSSAQWFLTACRLMQQTLAVTEREQVRPKALRRFDLKDDTITVIRLRRPKHAPVGDGEHAVEWNFQWIVRGHWRRQPYKDAETGGVVYRMIYINPFMKGDQSKPLKRSRILNVWDR
jgi:hypothetical protein